MRDGDDDYPRDLIKTKIEKTTQHNALLIGLFILVSTTILSAQDTFRITIVDESKDPLGVTVLITPCDCGGISNTSGILAKVAKGL